MVKPPGAPSAPSSTVKPMDQSAVSGDDLTPAASSGSPRSSTSLPLTQISSAYDGSSILPIVLDLCNSPDLASPLRELYAAALPIVVSDREEPAQEDSVQPGISRRK
ncbi:hypothetical protein NL676_006458 [Syzygium grande]|nr:hypothetical protein NL676_006458 [Syzygium grande]